MEVTSFTVERYRAFREPQTVELAPITLVIGKNNTGKSALLRAPHFLSLPLSGRSASLPFPLEEEGFGRHASTLREVAWGEEVSGFGGALRWKGGALELENVTSLSEKQHRQHVSRLRLNGALIDTSGPWRDVRAELAALGAPLGVPMCWNLTGVRAAPLHHYKYRGADVLGPAVQGEWAPYQLLQAGSELEVLNRWAERILECRFRVEPDNYDFEVRVRSGGGPWVNFANCGDGVAQLLPVLTMLLLSARDGRPNLLCIEQPDLHLHPKAHLDLADLLIEVVLADPSVRLLVECHSDALLLRLRRRIAEQADGFTPAHVQVLYVEQREGASRVNPIRLNQRGVPDHWPKGVFAEAAGEYVAMRRALSDDVR